MTGPRLVVVAGLPGVGKTALAREIATTLGATFLRIDTIEAAIVSTLAPFEGNPVGYVVAERVAADQLRAGRPVVVDAVNGVEIAVIDNIGDGAVHVRQVLDRLTATS